MLRSAMVAAAAICAIGLAPAAQAQPKFCTGKMYVTACAGGGGGAGSAMMGYQTKDENGNPTTQHMRQKDFDNMYRKLPH